MRPVHRIVIEMGMRAPGESSEAGTLGLKLLFVFGPATGMMLSGVIIWNFPLIEERHREMAKELEAQRRSIGPG